MRIKLVSRDSTIPNNALLRIYTYYKQQGHTVGWDVQDPDEIYCSIVFPRGRTEVIEEAPNIHYGGSGYDLTTTLPDEIEFIRPDYSLYDGMVCRECRKLLEYCKCHKPKPGNMEYSLGFTTRGCIRACPFCIVREKEGYLHRHQPISDFHDKEHKTVILLDNNVYADKDWFFKNTDYILDNHLKWCPIQGMDIRIIDSEIAARLKELSWAGSMHFAWDNMADEAAVMRGLKILKEAGIDLKHSVDFYVLVNFNTTFKQDVYRVQKIRDMGANSSVMIYDLDGLRKDPIKRKRLRGLQRYTMRKWVYHTIDFESYTLKKNRKNINTDIAIHQHLIGD